MVSSATGKHADGNTWYNHMAAAEIRSLVGQKVWESYFKFCVVRNPFDKAVSYWWMVLSAPERLLFLAQGDFAEIKTRFKSWIMSNSSFPVGNDRRTYMIDGKVCVDYCLRHERLLADLKIVCDRIGIDFEPSRLGRYKSDIRRRPEDYGEYYDAESKEKVENMFEYELSRFGLLTALRALPSLS